MKRLKMTDDGIEEIIARIRENLKKEFLASNAIPGQLILPMSLGKPKKNAEVHFGEDAYLKIQHLVKNCDSEIGFDGTVTRDLEDPSVFWVDDIILFPQKVTGATVDTDDDKYREWLEGLDDDTFNRRRFNGHSHVNMAVSPSGTDIKYRSDSIKNVRDFFIYGIFNKSGKYNLEIFDVENNIIYDNDEIDMWCVPGYDEWAAEEIKKNVVKHTYTATAGVYQQGKIYQTACAENNWTAGYYPKETTTTPGAAVVNTTQTTIANPNVGVTSSTKEKVEHEESEINQAKSWAKEVEEAMSSDEHKLNSSYWEELYRDGGCL